ncbi:hypothetical protein [Paenibacillus sp. YPG26]|uniref:hypothetical protein n=1 Tax=Paenibacillus sp. YPG26 TaxID=2878915 RepID=UPI002041163B|nr:hypothetical protein [Paenibacillus sp. YPG26]USB34813.1 hypothetical protein LDO05_08715 [Paenibacillus sp. YPG26]
MTDGTQRQEMWRQYILGELSPGKRDELDQWLAEDETALEEYLVVFESMEHPIGDLPDIYAFTDRVMNALPVNDSSVNQPLQLHRKWAWIKHPITHYTIAASITLLLITSGFFDRLEQNADHLWSGDNGSISEQWLSRTTSWLDSWNRSDK